MLRWLHWRLTSTAGFNNNAKEYICMLSTRIWNQFAVLQLLSFSITVANWQDMLDIGPGIGYFEGKVLHLRVSLIMVIGVFAIQSMFAT